MLAFFTRIVIILTHCLGLFILSQSISHAEAATANACLSHVSKVNINTHDIEKIDICLKKFSSVLGDEIQSLPPSEREKIIDIMQREAYIEQIITDCARDYPEFNPDIDFWGLPSTTKQFQYMQGAVCYLDTVYTKFLRLKAAITR